MVRSLGFGSNTAYSFALLRLAFASAPFLQLNLACNINSPVHSAKGTPSPFNGLWLLVSTWFQYSISLPSRGSFHLSLSVLVHYRSLESRYSKEFDTFRLQDFHPLRFNFPANSTMYHFSYSYIRVLQPQIRKFGLGFSLFARHY